MKRIIRILFFTTLGLFAVFSFRGQYLPSMVSFACGLGLWLVYFILYAHNISFASFAGSAERFQPVSLVVGVLFVAVGIWDGIRFLPGVPTLVGSIFFSIVFVLLPVCCGVVIIRREWRRRRHSN
ncbi:MAG: hypothetical protein DMG96_24990 [Acidobacteria bacterium]|nr:MAG: hypothetical protein DMG96_24990 [Acidobacteriota bacterium]